MKTRPCLLIRADAYAAIGTGHVMRCLALAQEWMAAGGNVCLRGRIDAPGLRARLQRDGVSIVDVEHKADECQDATASAQAAKSMTAQWMVADSYALGAAFQRAVKDAGVRLLVFDDMGTAAPYTADVVLNQNLHATSIDYSRRDAATRLLLGTSYVLLRNEFLAWSEWTRTVVLRAKSVLITLGGSDSLGLTAHVARTIVGIEGVRVRIVAGPAFAHHEALQTLVAQHPSRAELLIDPPDMAAEMARADIAVAASGSIAWELAFMGLPAVLIATSPDQERVATELARRRIAVITDDKSAGETVAQLLADHNGRASLSAAGRQVVDGRGRMRVVAAMLENA